MFAPVEAHRLLFLADAQPEDGVRDGEGDYRGQDRPRRDDEDGDDLKDELVHAEERPAAVGADPEDGDQDRSDGTRPAVDGEDAADVVDLERVDDPAVRRQDQRAAEAADDDAAPPRDVRDRARDGHEAGE